ncbi:cold-inducible protein YdjO-related protein [Paenibacillus oceani]|nr:cold-inducible protein YdjO-related protein [Paenibacillus oceani]
MSGKSYMEKGFPRNSSPFPLFETPVWKCSDTSCTCWMRVDLAFEESPSCPICSKEMVLETKMLPKLTTVKS